MVVILNSLVSVYAMFILSYLLNVLITELPLKNRYQRLRQHFTFWRCLSISYYPVTVWFSMAGASSRQQQVRHRLVFITSGVMVFTHFFGYTTLTPALHFIVFSILAICWFTDIECQIIPNELSFGLIGIGFFYSMMIQTTLNSAKGMGVAILVFVVFSLIMRLFGQRHAFGAGDIKLCLGIGAVWGWQVTAIALYFTFLIGGILGFYFLYIQKKDKTSYVAFAPAIILGLLVALVYTDNIFDYYYPWINQSFEIKNITPR
jgi:leader peptidase (prepilin peptidase)/N-methyltransferase